MKHTLKITAILISAFLLAQLVGLLIVGSYIDVQHSVESGNVTYESLPLDMERPQMEQNWAFLYILLAVLLGTVVLLLLIRFRKNSWWKAWFFLAVVLCLVVAFSPFLRKLLPDIFQVAGLSFPEIVAIAAAIALAFFKVIKPNIYVHNITELFIYGGIAAIFVPELNILSMLILLGLISLYDMYAVWKSKHMVSLAKFQSESKVFAGLSIPYGKLPKGGKDVKLVADKKGGISIAILGGGDIAFPLLFAGVVFKGLLLTESYGAALLESMIIPLFAALALLILFIRASKERFYPAMPFITAGCLVGYGLLLLF